MDQSAANAACFIRKSFKYWVLPQNVVAVRDVVAKHLPQFHFKDPEDLSHSNSDVVQSIYLDNDVLDLYSGRLLKSDSSRLIRFRWYGDEKPTNVQIEQKLHKNTWQGEISVKKRFSLSVPEFFDFLQKSDELCGGQSETVGDDKEVKDEEWEEEEVKEDEVKTEEQPGTSEFAQMSNEVQQHIGTLNLKPKMFIRYNRTRFQVADEVDPPIRVSLDRDVQVATTDEITFDWNAHFQDMDDSRKYSLPFAVLEVKLRLDNTDGSAVLPNWAQELVDNGMIMHIPKFSKYAHSTSTLYWDEVNVVPKWLTLIPKFVQQIDQSIPMSELYHRFSTSKIGRTASLRKTIEDSSDDDDESHAPSTGGFLLRLATLFKRSPSVEPSPIDPKEFFANERTFLQWVRSSILIALLGVAILSIGFSGEWISGLILVLTSQIIMIRSLATFYRRGKALKTNEGIGVFDDTVGPFSLVVAFCLATALYAVYAVILVEKL